jgi:hypothetical protein
MQLAMKRGSLLLASLAVLIATMALVSSSASASQFCGGQQTNKNSKCFGAARYMLGATAKGESTGVCVGADLTEGSCVPVHDVAGVMVPGGVHNPWVVGTGSAFTLTASFTYE